jgi:hypothetical protein
MVCTRCILTTLLQMMSTGCDFVPGPRFCRMTLSCLIINPLNWVAFTSADLFLNLRGPRPDCSHFCFEFSLDPLPFGNLGSKFGPKPHDKLHSRGLLVAL